MQNLRQALIRHLMVLAFFSGLTIIFTYPLILHLSDSVIGGHGDNLYFAWLTNWYEQSFFSGIGHPFFNPMMNWPEGWNLSTTDTALASVFPGAVFSHFFGPIAGYNLAMLLTFILSGWAMYVWVRHLTKCEGAALLAGVTFALLPYRMAHFLIGHLNLAGTQWFPLFFMGLVGMLRGEAKGWWRPAVLAAVSLGLIGFTSMYYLYMGLIVTVVFVLAYLIFNGFGILKQPSLWKQTGLFMLITTPLLYLSLRYFMDLSAAGTIAPANGIMPACIQPAQRISSCPPPTIFCSGSGWAAISTATFGRKPACISALSRWLCWWQPWCTASRPINADWFGRH